MRYSIPLAAGIPQKQFFRGRCIAIISTGAAPEVKLTIYGTDVQDGEDFGGCGRNFSIFYPDRYFSGVELTVDVDATVEIIVANANVQTLDGANLTASIDAAQLPLPVQTEQGDAPANPLYVTGITYEDTPAAANANAAAVAVGDVVAAVAAASATRLELRMTNIGTDAVAIGAAGLTWAQRCVILQPGDTWVEVKGAALAWYGITDAAKSASVTKQELTA